ncbi:MAG: peptidoglycan-binding domain-containing protein [Bryobacteraceae bacterium]
MILAAGEIAAQDTPPPAAKPKTSTATSGKLPTQHSTKQLSKNSGKQPTHSPAAATHSASAHPVPTRNVSSTAPTTAVRRRTTQSGKKPVAAAPHRSAQQQPTQERYKEIQTALTERGYFSGTPDGTWGPESSEALKRFQRDQNLTDDGKIGSLSLIALGLGPKRMSAGLQPAPSPAELVPEAPKSESAPEPADLAAPGQQ